MSASVLESRGKSGTMVKIRAPSEHLEINNAPGDWE
jgi:hypothetical protein